MGEIPDDIMKAAKEAWRLRSIECRESIAHAILAERKRCADVAKAYLTDLEGCDMREDEPLLISAAIMDPSWKPPKP